MEKQSSVRSVVTILTIRDHHAPLTSVFLTCNLVHNGFDLFIPTLVGCFVAKYTAKLVCSYTVYSYKGKKAKPKELADPEMHLAG